VWCLLLALGLVQQGAGWMLRGVSFELCDVNGVQCVGYGVCGSGRCVQAIVEVCVLGASSWF
jgi:hypothetical protein